jgi:hypothetical protein
MGLACGALCSRERDKTTKSEADMAEFAFYQQLEETRSQGSYRRTACMMVSWIVISLSPSSMGSSIVLPTIGSINSNTKFVGTIDQCSHTIFKIEIFSSKLIIPFSLGKRNNVQFVFRDGGEDVKKEPEKIKNTQNHT